MFIKDLKNCSYSRVLDDTVLCEFLHPSREKQDLKMGFSIAHAILSADKSSKPHKMRTSLEIYYMLEGKGKMHIDNESQEVNPGQAIYIPPNSVQWIENIGESDLKFLCMVYPPWSEEDEELCVK
jgi:mannose-6-phosphate isomerase-like protein (cupin superfamily)